MKDNYIRATFTNFITELIKNASIDYYRSQRKYINEISIDIIEEENILDDVPSALFFAIDENIKAEELEKEFTDINLYNAMKDLKIREKQVIYLTVIKEMSAEEVAVIMRTSSNAIY